MQYQALRISLTQPARNHPRKTTTAATTQISAAKIVQSAKAVTPRSAETHRNRPPTKAKTAAIKGARMISPGDWLQVRRFQISFSFPDFNNE